MAVNSIRITSPFCTREELIRRLKDNSALQPSLRPLDLEIQKANIPILKGRINAQKIHKQLSEEQIKRINTHRKLPNGYLLGFTPQKIIHHYLSGCYNGSTIIPPTYTLIKTDKMSAVKKKYMNFRKKLPECFKIINTNDGTYITGKDVTKEELNKYFSSTMGKIKTGIRNFFHPELK